MNKLFGTLAAIGSGIVTVVFALMSAILLLAGPVSLFKTMQKVGKHPMGSGKPTKAVNSGITRIIIVFALTGVLSIARLIVQRIDVLAICTFIVNLLCLVYIVIIAKKTRAKDITERKNYERSQIESVTHESQLASANAQLKANRAMAKGSAKVVQAKVGTAVATERAKQVAVNSATAHIAAGAIAKPKEAIEYAQASGALAEGKELADKFADNLMGDNAPTVIDGQYADVTEEAKAVMSDADAQLVEHIKGMTRDVIESTLRLGAGALMIDVEGRSVEEIAGDVLKYSPHEYIETLPNELSDVEKAVVVVEGSSKS